MASSFVSFSVMYLARCSGHKLYLNGPLNSASCQKTFLTFPPANLNAQPILAKIKQFNADLSGTGKELRLNELSSIQELTQDLSKPVTNEATQSLAKMIDNWPSDKKFPGIDLARNIFTRWLPLEILPSLLNLVETHSSPDATSSSLSTELNLALCLRSFSNLLSSYSRDRASLSQQSQSVTADELVQKFLASVWSEGQQMMKVEFKTKAPKVALATLFLNFSVMGVEGSLKNHTVISLIKPTSQLTLREIDKEKDLEEEALYRILIALGNLIWIGRDSKANSDVIKQTFTKVRQFYQNDLNLDSLNKNQSNHSHDRIQDVVDCIKELEI